MENDEKHRERRRGTMFRRGQSTLVGAKLSDLASAAAAQVEVQGNPALFEALSEAELREERRVAEGIRQSEREQRAKVAEAAAAEEDRARRTHAQISKIQHSDTLQAQRALAALRRSDSAVSQLAGMHRARTATSWALSAGVAVGMLWSAINVQQQLVPSGSKSDPLFWASYGIEALISIQLIALMVSETKTARWGGQNVSRGKSALAEIGLLVFSLVLNSGRFALDGEWYKAGQHAVAPLMVGSILVVHSVVAERYSTSIRRAAEVAERETGGAIGLANPLRPTPIAERAPGTEPGPIAEPSLIADRDPSTPAHSIALDEATRAERAIGEPTLDAPIALDDDQPAANVSTAAPDPVGAEIDPEVPLTSEAIVIRADSEPDPSTPATEASQPADGAEQADPSVNAAPSALDPPIAPVDPSTESPIALDDEHLPTERDRTTAVHDDESIALDDDELDSPDRARTDARSPHDRARQDRGQNPIPGTRVIVDPIERSAPIVHNGARRSASEPATAGALARVAEIEKTPIAPVGPRTGKNYFEQELTEAEIEELAGVVIGEGRSKQSFDDLIAIYTQVNAGQSPTSVGDAIGKTHSTVVRAVKVAKEVLAERAQTPRTVLQLAKYTDEDA